MKTSPLVIRQKSIWFVLSVAFSALFVVLFFIGINLCNWSLHMNTFDFNHRYLLLREYIDIITRILLLVFILFVAKHKTALLILPVSLITINQVYFSLWIFRYQWELESIRVIILIISHSFFLILLVVFMLVRKRMLLFIGSVILSLFIISGIAFYIQQVVAAGTFGAFVEYADNRAGEYTYIYYSAYLSPLVGPLAYTFSIMFFALALHKKPAETAPPLSAEHPDSPDEKEASVWKESV